MDPVLQTAIPCTFMRGGTSRGPYFRRSDLPEDRETMGKVILAAVGSPDVRQIDGIGGATTLTTKVAIVSPAAPGEPQQVDYLFAQPALDRAFVDWGPTCGNMLAGVGPFAIESGMVPAEDGETRVRIRAVNTGALIEAVIQTPGGRVTYEGDTAIAGVPGTAAPVLLNFADAVGGATGKLLPTGNALDRIEGVDVTCLDVCMPVVIARAKDLGKTAHETAKELDADKDFFARIEKIRRAASLAMGMGDAEGRVIPKFAMIAEPAADGVAVTARYFTPLATHEAMAVTGGICIASACKLPGTVAEGIARVTDAVREAVVLAHPTGTMEAVISTAETPQGRTITAGGTLRTARRLMTGDLYIPSRVWAGKGG